MSVAIAHTLQTMEGASNRDGQVVRIVTSGARRIASGAQRPHDVVVDLLVALQSIGASQPGVANVLQGVHRDACLLWGFLADAVDGPPNYARGLSVTEVQDLMRLAASEWLALDPTPAAMTGYFDRWLDWPDSLNRG